MTIDNNDEKFAYIDFENFLAQIKHPLLALRFINEILYNKLSKGAYFSPDEALEAVKEVYCIIFLIKYTLDSIIEFRDLCTKRYVLEKGCSRVGFDEFLS